MGGVLYRLQTNTTATKFNICMGVVGDTFSSIGLEQYEFLAEPLQVESAPIDVVTYLLKQPADTSGLAERQALLRVGSGFKRKEPDPEKIPDVWTAMPLPVVTEAGKELLEEIDPSIHQFVPFALVTDPGGALVETSSFYFFICGRLIDIPEHSQTSDPSTHDTQTIEKFGLCRWRTIQERPDIQTYLDQLPIWRFYDAGGRASFHINKRFLDAAHQRGLKGFKETSNRILRDVQHVWY